MKQYDKIVGEAHEVRDAIDFVLQAFNHRRRNNNTTEFEDIQIVAMGVMFVVVMIVSYDDYKADTSQAPPDKPRYIGVAPVDHSDN